MDITDRVIIITGASAGIGLATATHLSDLGARLVLAARDTDALHHLEGQLPGSMAVPTDITQPDQAARLVEQTLDRHGRIDVLVNNAARAMAAPVEHIDLDAYSHLLELNLLAPLRLMQLVIPTMRAHGGGHIVTISSQASTKAIPYIAGYASTKSALDTLSLTARTELADDDITVSIIKPGIVDTDFGQNTPHPEPDELRRAPDGTLHPHIISPTTVAHAVADILRTGDAVIDLIPA
ncbi:MAG: SDR family oxidoreductase [Candidatus Nanopelagicales bacterium]